MTFAFARSIAVLFCLWVFQAAYGLCDFSQDLTEQQAEAVHSPKPASFEVISIRQSDPANGGFSIRPDDTNLRVTGSSLLFLIQLAYDMRPSQVEEFLPRKQG